MAVPLHCRKFLHVFAKSLIPQKHWSHLVMISLTLQSDWKNVLFQQALELFKKKKLPSTNIYDLYRSSLWSQSQNLSSFLFSLQRRKEKKKTKSILVWHYHLMSSTNILLCADVEDKLGRHFFPTNTSTKSKIKFATHQTPFVIHVSCFKFRILKHKLSPMYTSFVSLNFIFQTISSFSLKLLMITLWPMHKNIYCKWIKK